MKQYIQEDGTKRFAKDSRKEGCFHAVGGLDQRSSAPALVIAEGSAIATTLSDALGHATVVAFDSDNLPPVAAALKARLPDKAVVIAGDNDVHAEQTQGINPGRTQLEEAARAVGGKAFFRSSRRASNPKIRTRSQTSTTWRCGVCWGNQPSSARPGRSSMPPSRAIRRGWNRLGRNPSHNGRSGGLGRLGGESGQAMGLGEPWVHYP